MIDRTDSAIAALCLTVGGGFITGSIIGQLTYTDGERFVEPWLGVFGILGALMCAVGAILHWRSLDSA